MRRAMIVLLIFLVGCSNKYEDKIPNYSEILYERNNNLRIAYDNLVSKAREYEINLLYDYIFCSSEEIYSHYTYYEEGSDINGGIDIYIGSPEPKGAYSKEAVESLCKLTESEGITILSSYSVDENNRISRVGLTKDNLDSINKAYMVSCNPVFYYLYNDRLNIIEQVLYLDREGSNDCVLVVTWGEEGCLNVKVSKDVALW